MNYDDWKSTEPSYMQDEPLSKSDPEWDRQFDAWKDEEADVDRFEDEYPQDDTSILDNDFETVEYKERVVNDLLNAMDEFLSFSTFRELMKLIVGNV